MALGDRIVVMEHGRVAQVGRPRDIYQRPRHPLRRRVHRHHEPAERQRARRRLRDRRPAAFPGPRRRPARREVLFRPEDVTLGRDRRRTSTARVAAAFFLGDRTRLFVQVGEAKPLVVETSARRDFQHGEAVGLNVDPRGLMAI